MLPHLIALCNHPIHPLPLLRARRVLFSYPRVDLARPRRPRPCNTSSPLPARSPYPAKSPSLRLSNFPKSRKAGKPESRQVGKRTRTTSTVPATSFLLTRSPRAPPVPHRSSPSRRLASAALPPPARARIQHRAGCLCTRRSPYPACCALAVLPRGKRKPSERTHTLQPPRRHPVSASPAAPLHRCARTPPLARLPQRSHLITAHLLLLTPGRPPPRTTSSGGAPPRSAAKRPTPIPFSYPRGRPNAAKRPTPPADLRPPSTDHTTNHRPAFAALTPG